MRTRAIILKKLPLREDDELVVAYTETHGKQRYLAKSSLRSESLQGSHLDVLNAVRFSVIEGKRNFIIASAVAERTYPRLKLSLRALAIASMVLEAFDLLVYDHDADAALWNFLINTLDTLDSGGRDRDWIETELVKVLGYHTSTTLEDIAPRSLLSLQFLRNVVI